VEAARWYGYSARYGLAQGQYNFATMLERGDGLARDDIEAYKFYVLAARGGFTGVPYDNGSLKIDRNAPTPAEAMQRRMSAAQVAEGRARADAFKPETGPLKI
jgi:TPR repeat protein